jgi:predicted ATPase
MPSRLLNERGPQILVDIRQKLESQIDLPLLVLIENIIPLLGYVLARTKPSDDMTISEDFSISGPLTRRAVVNDRRRRSGRLSTLQRMTQRTKGDDSSRESGYSSTFEAPKIDPGQTRDLLQFAVRTFLRIFASTLGPVVVVVDDLQWADNASLDVLKAVAKDRSIDNLMIIGCYRSDFVDEGHSLARAIQDLKVEAITDAFSVTEIVIGNLTRENLRAMLVELLSTTQEKAMGLADICLKRTMGNAFFVKVFLSMLQDTNILEFNCGSFQWGWDDTLVELLTGATDNVVDVIKAKLEKSPEGMILLLQVASCLGNTFKRSILEDLWTDQTQQQGSVWNDTFEDLLKVACRDMLLEPVGDDTYKFVHDKIQETALLLIPNKDFHEFRSSIGKRLLLNLEGEENIFLFVVVDLLNNGHNTGFEIAHINAMAAERARNLSAFVSAVRYVEYGILSFDGADFWKSHPDVALKLHSIGAEAEECIGNSEKAAWYCREILSRPDVPTIDKIRANKIVVERLYSDGKYDKLWGCSLDVLGQLGVHIPRQRFIQKISAKIALYRTQKYDFPSTSDVQELSEMEDATKKEALELMIKVASFCLGSKNKPLYILLCCKCVRFTAQYGLTTNTASAFASFANVLMHEHGDWKSALKVAEVAQAVDKRFASNYCKTSTLHKLNLFVLGWVRPLRTCRAGYLEAYRLGMLSGNIEGVGMSILFLMMSQFFSGGCTLQSVDSDLEQYIPQLERLKLHSFALGLRLLWQKVLNLMDVSYNPHTFNLTGTAMHGIDIERHPYIYNTVGRHHICNLCAYFAEYEKGAEIALAMGDSFYQTWSGASYFGFEPFSRALCLYAMVREKPSQAKKYLAAARRARAPMSKWVKLGAINLVHQFAILEAEEMALKGNLMQVKIKYEQAIVMAARGGFLQDCGIAHERFAVFLMRGVEGYVVDGGCDRGGQGRNGRMMPSLSAGPNRDSMSEATHHIEQAVKYFTAWGAHRKVKLLREKYSMCFSDDDTVDA